jgi:6-phosphogluconolactonase
MQPTHGADPCHVIIGGDGRFLLVANYSSGSVTVLPVERDGRIAEASDVIQHHGSGAHSRQQGPHAHSVALDAAEKFAYVADLGLDKVMIYRFDDRKGKLLSSDPPWADLKPGSGPRHMTFSPDGDTLYVLSELRSTLTAFEVDRRSGALKERQTLSTLPPDFKGENFAADVHTSPAGDILYTSNRGHDSIAVFGVDKKTGTVSCVQHQSTMGKWPRNFTLDPSGSFLLAANQQSDLIVVFAINEKDGRLNPNGVVIQIPEPACLKFAG